MAIVRSDSVVIRRRDLRETSLLVTFFTLAFGKVTGELKGIRKEPKKFSSSVQLFSRNEIIFYQRRHSGIHLVSQCDSVNDFPGIRSSARAIAAASMMCELLDVVCGQEDDNEGLFRLLTDTLGQLDAGAPPLKVTTIFKIKALALSGFKPHFDSCLDCGGSDGRRFSPKRGGLLCARCGAKEPASRPLLAGTLNSILYIEKSPLAGTLRLSLAETVRAELDAVLNSFLDFHIGRTLRSERVMHSL